MGLTRDVMIDGIIYGYHEVSMLECVPNDHITVTVENFSSEENKLAGEMPRDTYHELPWPKNDTIYIKDAEEYVFRLNIFTEYANLTDELKSVKKALRERETTIKTMEKLLTTK